MRILIVEDNRGIGNAMQEQLTADAHAVDWVTTLADARGYQVAVDYQLILLDLMLPDGFGIHFLTQLRAQGKNIPVIIMTALDQVSQRIEGLDAGADDYLVKPVDLMELSARVKSVLRRYHGNPNPILQFGNMDIDLVAKSACLSGKAIKLTAYQFAILEILASRPERIFTKTQLENSIYGFSNEFESNTLEAHISRMRKKLGAGAIETVHGMGYKMGKPSR